MAAVSSNLTTMKQPLAIRTDCITPQPTTLHVRQVLSWSSGDFTAKTADGALLLSCKGKVLSNTNRKEFQDASGLPLFSLRMSWFSMARAWRLELPGDGHMVMAVHLRWSFGKVKLDCTFTNAASDGEGQEVTLEVRGQDHKNLVTDITYGGTKVASVRRVLDGSGKGGNWVFKPEYEVDVAGGMDMALIAVIVIIMASSMQSLYDTGPPKK